MSLMETYCLASISLGTDRNRCTTPGWMPRCPSHVTVIPMLIPQKVFLENGLGSILTKVKYIFEFIKYYMHRMCSILNNNLKSHISWTMHFKEKCFRQNSCTVLKETHKMAMIWFWIVVWKSHKSYLQILK